MTYEHREWPKYLLRANGEGRGFANQAEADARPDGPWLTREQFAAVKVKPPKEAPGAHGAVEIPADWQKLVWFALKSLASKVSDEPITDKASAISAIEAELKRRG